VLSGADDEEIGLPCPRGIKQCVCYILTLTGKINYLSIDDRLTARKYGLCLIHRVFCTAQQLVAHRAEVHSDKWIHRD
jgi:hypothetical protein